MEKILIIKSDVIYSIDCALEKLKSDEYYLARKEICILKHIIEFLPTVRYDEDKQNDDTLNDAIEPILSSICDVLKDMSEKQHSDTIRTIESLENMNSRLMKLEKIEVEND